MRQSSDIRNKFGGPTSFTETLIQELVLSFDIILKQMFARPYSSLMQSQIMTTEHHIQTQLYSSSHR